MKRYCPTCGRPMKAQKATGLMFAKPQGRKGRGCPVHQLDVVAKQRLGYTNPKSYVRRDGSEVLYKEDWQARVLQLAMRSRGACERLSVLGRQHDVDCNGRGGDPHHIKKRWPRRDDRLVNLADLSRACHDAEDPRKIRRQVSSRRTQ